MIVRIQAFQHDFGLLESFRDLSQPSSSGCSRYFYRYIEHIRPPGGPNNIV